jgi:carboxypeptidase D
VLLREFILGDNQTGLVIDSSDNPIGPDHADLVIGAGGDILRADPVVYTGAGTTQGSIVAPSATVAAWDQFMATRWASTRPTSSVAQISDAFSVRMPWGMLTWVLVLCVGWIS